MKNRPLRHQLIGWMIMFIVVPSLLIMTIYTVEQIKLAKQKNLELINQRVTFQKTLIDYWMTERAGTVHELSQTNAFRGLDEASMKEALNSMQQIDNNFDSLSYINKDGLFQLSTLSQGIKYPSAIGKHYFEIAKTGKEYISDVVIGRNSGQAIVNFSSPIYDYSGNFQGLILGSIRTSMLETLLRGNWIGKTGEIILVNRQGILLTETRFSDNLLARGLVDGSAGAKVRISDEAVSVIQYGESGTLTWTDYLNNKVLGAYINDPEHGWTVIGKINEDEVLAPIYTQLGIIAGGTIFIIILVFLLAALIANRITRPIEWLIGQSNLVAMEKYTIVSQNEFLGKTPRELDILCETFIEMSGKIAGTVGLLKERESLLTTKVQEICEVNIALDQEAKDREKAEVALQRKLEMEEVLANISRKLLSLPIQDIDQEVCEVLRLIGEFTGVDRCAVFLDNTKGTACTMRYFWCREEDERFVYFRSFDITNYFREREQLGKLGHFAVLNLHDLPLEGNATKKFMEVFGWQSLLAFPMATAQQILGILVLATVNETKAWNQEQVNWLKIVNELIINSIERKQILDRLSQRDKEYGALMDAVPDLFFEINKDGTFLSAKGLLNSQAFQPEQIIGESIFDVYPNEVAQVFFDNVQTAIENKLIETFEYDILIDNKLFSREARIVSKKANEALAVIRDITEEKRAKQKIIEASRLVAEGQRLASLGVMATSIAHEINQPLNSIKVSSNGVVYANSNRVKLTKEDMLREFASISEQADRIDGIIKNIRMFVKNDYSPREDVDLGFIVYQAVKNVSAQPLLREISIKTNVARNLPAVFANPIHLQQVILNLISNAARSVSQTTRDRKVIRIDVCVEDSVILEVRDNGIGLPNDMAKKIFEPFFSFASDDQSMGLGLSIVQAIVTAYGGKVDAYNNDMGGATFRVELPGIAS